MPRRIVPIAIFSYDESRDEPSSWRIQFPFLTVLDFRYLTVELCKLPWRASIRHDNPVATALVSKMGYKEEEKGAFIKRNNHSMIGVCMFSGERTKIKGILRRSIVNRFHLVYNKAKPVYESVLGTKSI